MGRRDAEFRDFFEAELPRLYRLAYLLVGNASEAEDLAEEAMVRTYRAWNRIKDREHPGAYARTVLVNHRRSILRRRHLAPEPAVRSFPVAPSDERFALWEGVLRLPVRQRNAIVLRYYEDLTEEETASVLDCPVGTVKSHVRRGLAKLRENFSNDVEAPREWKSVE